MMLCEWSAPFQNLLIFLGWWYLFVNHLQLMAAGQGGGKDAERGGQ